jgi:phage gp46-like protein
MADASLFNTPEGGEIDLTGGDVALDTGLMTAVYLTLFGADEPWWGDIGEAPERRYPGKTGALVQALPLSAANLRRVEKTAEADLATLVPPGVISSARVVATIPAVNTLQLAVDVNGEPLIVFEIAWTRELERSASTATQPRAGVITYALPPGPVALDDDIGVL